jgi:Flp pilus assembly protein TadG
LIQMVAWPHGSARGRERGATVVEFALVVPVLVASLVGIVEFGRLFMADQDVATASREGARYALSGARYDDCDGIRAAAANLASRSGVTEVDVMVEYDHGPDTATFAQCPIEPSEIASGDRIVVTVTRTVTPVIPLYDPVTVRATERRTITKADDS